MKIRRATAADVPRIVSLLIEDAIGASEAAPTDPLYLSAFEKIDRDPAQLLWVGELDGEVIATVQLTFIPYLMHRGGLTALVEAVRVDDAHRSRGLGATLVQAAIAEARARGCTRVQLTTNKQRLAAHRFYERLGFVKSHEGFKLAL